MAQRIPEARVVAVIAETAAGGPAGFGSGFLLDATRVLTARHCVIDPQTGQPAVSLRVVRASDGISVPVAVGAMTGEDLDVALLVAIAPPPWDGPLPGGAVEFGALARDNSGELMCEAVGFPRWQEDGDGNRDVAEVHGPVRALEGKQQQRLVLRDPVLGGVSADDRPAWAGFSGAGVFHGGRLLGVVIEHHIRQGDTALQIRPVEAIARARDVGTRRLAQALGLDRDGTVITVTPTLVGGKPEADFPEGLLPADLQITDITVGVGKVASAGDMVKVHYVGVAHSTGEEFDSSWKRAEPLQFRLGSGRVIAGFDQGIQGMKVGGRRQLVIPPHLAYGDRGAPGAIKPGETLIFVCDLVSA